MWVITFNNTFVTQPLIIRVFKMLNHWHFRVDNFLKPAEILIDPGWFFAIKKKNYAIKKIIIIIMIKKIKIKLKLK